MGRMQVFRSRNSVGFLAKLGKINSESNRNNERCKEHNSRVRALDRSHQLKQSIWMRKCKIVHRKHDGILYETNGNNKRILGDKLEYPAKIWPKLYSYNTKCWNNKNNRAANSIQRESLRLRSTYFEDRMLILTDRSPQP